MNYYKTVSIIALILLIICLTFIGVSISSASNSYKFPPHVAQCPDYFVMNEEGKCMDVKNILPTGSSTNCNGKNFKQDMIDNNIEGTLPERGPFSELCLKKEWADTCGLNWDGITNNPEVCV